MERNHLTAHEQATAKAYLERLPELDSMHVSEVIDAANDLAYSYEANNEHKNNLRTFCGTRSNRHIIGTPFSAVYAIGGTITKHGTRPDIDLLVVNNYWWSSGERYVELNQYSDPFYRFLQNRLPGAYTLHGELPNSYDEGNTRGKVLITVQPPQGRNIDVNYVRNVDAGSGFITESEFIATDVDKEGKPLSRLILTRRELHL